jgi:hypothetical protein
MRERRTREKVTAGIVCRCVVVADCGARRGDRVTRVNFPLPVTRTSAVAAATDKGLGRPIVMSMHGLQRWRS